MIVTGIITYGELDDNTIGRSAGGGGGSAPAFQYIKSIKSIIIAIH